MIDLKLVSITRQELWLNHSSSLREALGASAQPIALVAMLLDAAGHVEIAASNADGIATIISSRSESGQDVELLFKPPNEILGGSKEIETVFLIVNALETTLKDAAYLPVDLRNDRIKSICESVSIQPVVFERIVRRWGRPVPLDDSRHSENF